MSHASEKKRTWFVKWALISATAAFLLLGMGLASRNLHHIHHDPIRGFEAWENHHQGGTWNTIALPQKGSTEVDVENFVAWWTPGQAALPAPIIQYTGLPAHWVLRGISWGCVFLFMAGLFAVFRQAGIGGNLLWASLFLVSAHHNTFLHFSEYMGGTTLILPLVPWFVFWLLKNQNNALLTFLGFVVFGLVGFCLKASFVLFLLAAWGYIAMSTPVKIKKIISSGAALLGVAVAVLWYTTQGPTPASQEDTVGFFNVQKHLLADFFTAPVLSLLAGFNFMEALFIPKTVLGGVRATYYLLLPLGVFSIWFLIKIFRQSHRSKLPLFFISGWLVLSVLHTYWYAGNKSISYELRHYLPLAVLGLPLLLRWVRKLRYGKVWAFMVLFAGLFFGGLKMANLKAHYSDGFVAQDGLVYPEKYATGMRYLQQMDTLAQTEGALFLVAANWHYTRALQHRDRAAIFPYNDNWVLNTGLEQTHYIPADTLRFERYQKIYLFQTIDAEPFIPKGFELKEEHLVVKDTWMRVFKPITD